MSEIWKSTLSVTELNKRGENTIVSHLGIVFIEVGSNFLVAKMPVDARTQQPLGIMHGGASCVLAETVGSTAANYCVDTEKFYCVGLSLFTNHIKSASKGYVFGKSIPLHLGKTTQVWNIDIHNEEERLISSTRLTMAVITKTIKF